MALKLYRRHFEHYLNRFGTTLCENEEFSQAAMLNVLHLRIFAGRDILSKAVNQC